MAFAVTKENPKSLGEALEYTTKSFSRRGLDLDLKTEVSRAVTKIIYRALVSSYVSSTMSAISILGSIRR